MYKIQDDINNDENITSEVSCLGLGTKLQNPWCLPCFSKGLAFVMICADFCLKRKTENGVGML